MEIAKDLNINDFTASVGWFYKFMQRWNVKPKKQTSCISLTLEDYWNYFMKWIIIERDFLNKNNLIIERHFMKTPSSDDGHFLKLAFDVAARAHAGR